MQLCWLRCDRSGGWPEGLGVWRLGREVVAASTPAPFPTGFGEGGVLLGAQALPKAYTQAQLPSRTNTPNVRTCRWESEGPEGAHIATEVGRRTWASVCPSVN